MIKNTLLTKKFQRFKSIKRGYFSLIIFVFLVLLSLVAEFFINNKALIVKYNNKYYFPIFSAMIPGTEFGLDYNYETNYKELYLKFKAFKHSNDFVLLPLVPFSPYEIDLQEGEYSPYPPDIKSKHFLGTDIVGRDILARLVFGFRYAILFSLLILLFNYTIGIIIGMLMGYYGGWFDLVVQRIIEIWSNIPFLYVVIIVSSLVPQSFFVLVFIMVFFGWIHMTWYIRTLAYKEKNKEYVAAAKTLGCSDIRIMLKHILPNCIFVIITFAPFSIASGITMLTALDYLGFGLPPPTPSWGEILAQGTSNLQYPWIVLSVVIAMIIVLTVVTFIGEAIREAWDPKQYIKYE